MALKIINAGFSDDLWLDTFKLLQNEYGLEPIYWTSSPKITQKLRGEFPKAIHHDMLEAVRGIPAHECRFWHLFPLDKELLDRFARHQLIAMGMMARMDPGGAFLYEERVRLYHRLLQYWATVLLRLDPELVIFPATPHLIYDYVLYCLCYHLGVKTMIVGTNSLNKFYLYDDLEEGHQKLKTAYQKKLNQGTGDFRLSGMAQKHWDYIRQANDANYLFTYRRYLERVRKNEGTTWQFAKGMMASTPRLPGRVVNFLFKPAPINYLKQKDKTIEESDFSGFGWRLNKRKAFQFKKRMSKLYGELCGKVDLKLPYIYVPLHYQPENTTSPNGDVFDNQILLVDLLSKSLPNGWHIYVKDYPNIFDYKLNGERARTEAYYHDLKAIPGVTLVPLDFNSFDLIDNSRAVATITGSAGWEAVCRSKPVLAFGYAWYLGCEGVFHTPTFEKCRESIEMIAHGYSVNQQKVKLFLHLSDTLSLPAYAESAFAEEFEHSHEENVRMLAEAIHKHATVKG